MSLLSIPRYRPPPDETSYFFVTIATSIYAVFVGKENAEATLPPTLGHLQTALKGRHFVIVRRRACLHLLLKLRHGSLGILWRGMRKT